MSLIAKPIRKNELWVVTDGSHKVGNVEANASGFQVKIGDQFSQFDSTKSIERLAHIEFQRPLKPAKQSRPQYAIWPTTGKTYNNVFDVKRRVHLFTKTQASKCYYAAGWFRILMNDTWQTVFCPKYIFVQRYEYQGPFMSSEEAENN
jgi:hypothetical protein